MKSLAEWLAEHPGRYVVIRGFDLYSLLPDGRKAVASVEMQSDLLSSPEIEAGSRLVQEAELAIGNLLSRSGVR